MRSVPSSDCRPPMPQNPMSPEGTPKNSPLLEAVTSALTRLLEPGDFDEAMNDALRLIGEADDADRVYVFENRPASDPASPLMSQRYEWVRGAVSAQIENPDLQNLSYENFPGLLDDLIAGRVFQKLARDFAPSEHRLLDPQQVLSLACTPIFSRGVLWGFVGIDDCRTERIWTEDQLLALKAAAAGLGGAIVRREADRFIESHARELKRQRAVALSLMEDARRSEQNAETASQAKTTFLAMMSHEIRTPLNGVIGFTDLLLAEGLPDRQSEIAMAIRTCGETLLSLISDILDITKIESGRLVLDPVNGNVEECLHAVLIAFEQMARRNRIAFSLELDPSCPRWLRLDFNRLRQVLFNLVGNAVKFTADGSIRIRAWSESNPSGGLDFHCSVRDSGTGIPPGEVQGIFEPFQQGEGARKAAVGGSGLGLTICRRLVEAMGGTISVESRPGEGTCFQFHVRTSEGVEELILPIPEIQPPSHTSNVRILVVDDVPTNVRLAASLFERLGFRTDAAVDGREAVQMARMSKHPLIVMDILMPELNGYEAARKIRIQEADLGLPRAWIVALTADAFVENRRKCAEAGMDDFLTKPLRISDLEKCIARWRAGVSVLQEKL